MEGNKKLELDLIDTHNGNFQRAQRKIWVRDYKKKERDENLPELKNYLRFQIRKAC